MDLTSVFDGRRPALGSVQTFYTVITVCVGGGHGNNGTGRRLWAGPFTAARPDRQRDASGAYFSNGTKKKKKKTHNRRCGDRLTDRGSVVTEFLFSSENGDLWRTRCVVATPDRGKRSTITAVLFLLRCESRSVRRTLPIVPAISFRPPLRAQNARRNTVKVNIYIIIRFFSARDTSVIWTRKTR